MNKNELKAKRKDFEILYAIGTYTQKEIAEKVGISPQTICDWVKESPTTKYIKIKQNLITQLEKISNTPEGNETLITNYLNNIIKLDTLIKKTIRE
jgi:DNA-binding XRE family transcriptional regulator